MKLSTILIILFCFETTNAQTGQNARDLRVKLFDTDGYDKRVRPAFDQTVATDIHVSFFVTSLNDIDMAKETMVCTGYFRIEWTDDYLKWTPASFGGLEYSHWPQDDIWKPDITVKNSVKDYKELGDKALRVAVAYDGSVTWSPFQVLSTECNIDISYFPYDVQSCSITVIAWSYTKADIYMRAGDRGINLDDFDESSEWDVIDSSGEFKFQNEDPSVVFTIELRRKPLYMMLNVFLPVLLLSILNLAVFIIPCQSGEKASYAITVFLSFAVFLTIVSDSLPQNSEKTAVFSIYIVSMTILSTISSFLAIIFIRLHHRKTEVPRRLYTLLCLRGNRPCRKRVDIEPIPLGGKIPNGDLKQNRKIFEENDEEKPVDWPSTVSRMDFLCFFTFLVVTAVISIVCLLVIACQPS